MCDSCFVFTPLCALLPGASLGSPRVKRIVHGQVAQLDEFPHQVGLERWAGW